MIEADRKDQPFMEKILYFEELLWINNEKVRFHTEVKGTNYAK